MAAGNGGKNREQRQCQHDAMHPQHPREGRRRSRIASVNGAADDQRLDREQQCCEQQPDTEHQMHPPIAYVDEAVPQIVSIQHVEPAQQH
jgi:hypothetical protein